MWTTMWRLLCLLTIMSALAAVAGLLEQWPPLLQGLAVLPGLLVTLLAVVAWWADSSTPSERK